MVFTKIFIFSGISLFISLCFANQDILNNRPIIGIVTEEIYESKIEPNATSQIYASYVKFLESSGARVVPIPIYESKRYYEDILSKINGVLFPGGAVYLNETGYGRTGRLIFDIATKMNNRGDYFPLWGTCLGFELLSILAVDKSWMTACQAQDLSTNLEFVRGYNDSRMLSDLDPKIENSMRNQNVVIHYHKWCLTPENFSLSGLDKYFKVLALNRDFTNTTFVSIIEAFNYPYYGVSFHPEKVVFEWIQSKTHRNIPHSLEAIKVSQQFGNFFVNEARKNGHSFPDKDSEDALLIYNYNPVYTGRIHNNPTEQKYYFY